MTEDLRVELLEKYKYIIDKLRVPEVYLYEQTDDLEDFKQRCLIHLWKILPKVDFNKSEPEIYVYLKRSLQRKMWDCINGLENYKRNNSISFTEYYGDNLNEDFTYDDIVLDDFDIEKNLIDYEFVKACITILDNLRDGYITKEVVFENKSFRELGRKYGKDKATIQKMHNENLKILARAVKKQNGLDSEF